MRRARTATFVIGAVTIPLITGAIVLGVLDRSRFHATDLLVAGPLVIATVSFTVVGGIIAVHEPRNWIGWAYQIVALSFALSFVTSEYASRAFVVAPGSLPFADWAAWVNNWLFVLPLSQLALAFLLFPDGHLPSRRWRPVAWALIGGFATGLLISMFQPGAIEVTSDISVPNVAAIGPASFWVPVRNVAAVVTIGAVILAVVSLFVRFRSARGETRQQVRWLAYVAGVALVFFLAALVSGIGLGPNETSPINDLSFVGLIVSLALGIPAATAVAVLKYRLYDLDLVVKKTAVFTIVALFLTGLYLVGLGLAALSGLGAIFGAILFVLTFNPVRRRARSLADRLVYGKRATPFEVLSEFSERVGETYSIDEVLPRMTQLLAASTGATEVRVWLRGEGAFTPLAAWPEDARAIGTIPANGDGLPDLGEGAAAYPVSHQGELLGAMTLHMPANDPMDPTKERLVNGLASQAGLALQNVRLVQDLRASRRRIVAAQDERAKRLERNIHDGAQQQLVALSVQLKLARTMLDRDPAKTGELLDTLGITASDALEDLRDLARGIYPPLLADKGLAAALESQARKAATPTTVETDGIGRYTPEIEAAVYFCSMEALTNAAKYASATGVEVRLAETDGELTFEVRDDGTGFDVGAPSRGTGRQGMSDRLEAIGGSLTVTSAPGAGTAVRGRIPVATTE